jgi:hypothetical protein
MAARGSEVEAIAYIENAENLQENNLCQRRIKSELVAIKHGSQDRSLLVL